MAVHGYLRVYARTYVRFYKAGDCSRRAVCEQFCRKFSGRGS